MKKLYFIIFILFKIYLANVELFTVELLQNACLRFNNKIAALIRLIKMLSEYQY